MSSRRNRIRAKIMARVWIDPVNGCYVWTGPDSGKNGRGKGYPRMSLDGQTVAVHIAMWTNEHGYPRQERTRPRLPQSPLRTAGQGSRRDGAPQGKRQAPGTGEARND